MPSLTAARAAILAIFTVHGILVGAWATHIPLAKDRLDVGPGWFGVALLAFPVGSIIAMTISAIMINRYGSAIVTTVTGLAFALLLLAPTHAPTYTLFLLAGIAMGAFIGSMDVAMNAHGLAIEKAIKTPIMSGLHGGFSLGAMIGSFGGAWLMHQLGESAQIILISALMFLAMLVASRFLLPGSVDRGLSGSHFAWPSRATIGLGLLCFLALMVEGSVMDWGALVMRESHNTTASFAALAFGCYQGGMAISRFSGDYLRKAFGAVRVVVWSAILAAIGTAVALVAPDPYIAFIAWIIGGIGIGNTAPVLFAGGGRLEPDAPGRGIAAVTTLGYAGFLAGPPMIGLVAELTTLPVALGLTVIAALIIAVFAKSVAPADTY